MRVTFFIVGALLALIPSIAGAEVAGADWKVFGGNSFDGTATYCFYDAKGVRTNPDGNLTFWDKCLAKKTLDAIDIKKDFDGQILDNSASKTTAGYKPPIAKYRKLSSDDVVFMIVLEEEANIADVSPKTKAEWELDCEQRRARIVDVSLFQNGKYQSIHRPGVWSDIAPETNAAALAKILCK